MNRNGESGRVLLLSCALVAFTLLLLAVISSAAAAHADRHHLQELAELGATAAATEFGPFRSPSVAELEAVVVQAIERATPPRLTEIRIAALTTAEPTAVPDPTKHSYPAVTLHLTASSRPPLLRWFTATRAVAIEAGASATLLTG